MRYDVLVIAGTTEARDVIRRQLEEKKMVLASVATELGAKMLEPYGIDVHIGRLDEEGFVRLLAENPCGKIIDASHPLCTGGHRNCAAGSREGGHPVRAV